MKVDPNIKDNNGRTPLLWASYHGYLDIVKCLIEEGKADPNIRDKYGETPLYVASKNGYFDIVKCLIKQGKADPNMDVMNIYGRKRILDIILEQLLVNIKNYLKFIMFI